MKRAHLKLIALAALAAAAGWRLFRPPTTTVLTFRIGQSFEEVVKNSSYPVIEQSNIPTHAWLQAGGTYVTAPAVVIHFDDPKHGFHLPPTKFATLSYLENRVASIATTPMLNKLPFDEAVAILENLQNQFKAGGWEPWEVDDSTWFDFTPDGKKRLYARMFEPGYMETQSLRVPKKYGMTFRLWCAEGCMTREPPYLFLIDVGVGSDVYGWEPGDRE